MGMIAQLPTSEVAELVRRLAPRLYINFFHTLPAEVCLKILGYLDPEDLIRTAQASREWMVLGLDRRLWEQLYLGDGFRTVNSEVKHYEDSINHESPAPVLSSSPEPRSISSGTPNRILPPSAKDESGDSDMMDVDTSMQKTPSIFGPPSIPRFTREPVQDDDITMASPPPQIPQYPSIQSKSLAQGKSSSNQPKKSERFFEPSSLVVYDEMNNKKWLNWQYLYAQRRRLEANWETEKFTNFRLPHPRYPEEGHEECIYTLQFSGRYLVSGSRDRTLRIWDLETQRLVRPPLRAHTGSVLCLQFDADPEEDLIVSGSSDATIVLWKFSTGQVIQRLRKAHRESILNVRFDKRVLVTCSKDKLIKIFNRRPMSPGEVGYPGMAGIVRAVPTYLENYGYNPSPQAGLPIIPPYSLIATLEGHGAAVNAVQVHGDEVVSASGDRTVKLWNWPRQTCTRTLIGHSKGIACVQYDGRRIVSGSSDNAVKIFDSASGVEVAALQAHTNLVRTVQAGFGDLPNSAEEDQEDAKIVDREYFEAVDSGVLSLEGPMKGRPTNAGSRKPEHITSYGAKVPPGGGGGKFGRIVSGSYDETIIIWRRDKEGLWKSQHVLRPEEVVTRMAELQNAIAEQNSDDSETDFQSPQQSLKPRSSAWYRHLLSNTLPKGSNALREALQKYPQLLTRPELFEKISLLPPAAQQTMQAVVTSAVHSQQQSTQAPVNDTPPDVPMSAPPQAPPTAPGTDTPQNNPAPTISPPTNSTAAPTASMSAPTTAPAPAPTPAPAPAATANHAPPNMSRVFKLQFDARRIIACSQASVIVGWDFANGDRQITEASRFFAPIE